VKHVGRTILAALVLTLPLAARAEVFVLTNGGRVTGELLNPEQSPRTTFDVKTPSGIRLSLEKAQVQQVLKPAPAEIELETLRATVPDTVESQWKLQEWCQQRGLSAARKEILQHILELDPNHSEARRVLGFNQVDGKWVTRDDLMKSRGYVLFRGRWLTPQEIEVLEAKEKNNTAEKEWIQKIARWKTMLMTDKDQAARENLLSIDDPQAIKGLSAVLKNDQRWKARVLYIEVLFKIGTPDALRWLASTSLEDSVEEVRLTALDYLKKKHPPDVVAYYVSQLKSKDNDTINRAAGALKLMNDRSAIVPLVDVLVTNHKRLLSPGTANGSITTTFPTNGTPGSGGLAMNQGPKYQTVRSNNPAVLDALVTLTGVNFDYDASAWKHWYASQKPREVIDARRSEKTDK